MRRRAFVAVVLSLAAAAPACADHAAAPTASGTVTVTGKVLHIADDSEVDGPIVLMIESPPGESVDLHFGSVFTSPSPDAARRATFAVVRRTKVGDIVRARGTRTRKGEIWLEHLEILDQD